MKQFNQLRSLSKKEKLFLQQSRNAIKALDPSADIILYGSRARGDAGPEADYDLLILADDEASLEKEDVFRRRLFPIELETGAVLTVMLVSRHDWEAPLYNSMPFCRNVKNEGVIL
ncbi:MAG: nucleotidyltransferase domain-containing protein [Proteobacteria bacterium]|nr:nucleotidyltransferase domain-containing protein [Pseudomonadota bacterium]